MSLNCYVVDDEFHAVGILTGYIQKTPGLELAGSSANPLKALEEITALRPALTFIDVDMPELNGLDLASLVNSFTAVIFTTSFREYGPEAFEKDASDYLLKPIAYERFLQGIQRVRKQPAARLLAPDTFPASFFVKSGTKGNMVSITISQIVFITGAINYIEIQLKERKIITYLTLGEILDKLPQERFSRIHKSYIINHDYIKAIEYGQVKIEGPFILPVGRAYRKSFREKMDQFFLLSKRDQPG